MVLFLNYGSELCYEMIQSKWGDVYTILKEKNFLEILFLFIPLQIISIFLPSMFSDYPVVTYLLDIVFLEWLVFIFAILIFSLDDLLGAVG